MGGGLFQASWAGPQQGPAMGLSRPHSGMASDAAVVACCGLSNTEEAETYVVFPAYLVVFGPCWGSQINSNVRPRPLINYCAKEHTLLN